jgi:hypothetical protein
LVSDWAKIREKFLSNRYKGKILEASVKIKGKN